MAHLNSLHLTSKLTQLRLFFLRSSLSAAPFLRASGASLGSDFLSSIRASQSVNSSSPGAEAVEVTEGSRRICGRTALSGLEKRGEELRAPGWFPSGTARDCRERRTEDVDDDESERSRELRERFGPGWKSTSEASESTGVGSWKRTVRFGLLLLVVEGARDCWSAERMEDWSVLV